VSWWACCACCARASHALLTLGSGGRASHLGVSGSRVCAALAAERLCLPRQEQSIAAPDPAPWREQGCPSIWTARALMGCVFWAPYWHPQFGKCRSSKLRRLGLCSPPPDVLVHWCIGARSGSLASCPLCVLSVTQSVLPQPSRALRIPAHIAVLTGTMPSWLYHAGTI
jgi:hypothetical protein